MKEERMRKRMRKKNAYQKKTVKWYKKKTLKGSEGKTRISRSKGYETSFKITG